VRVLGGGRLDDDQVQHVLDGFATLPAQPDAEPAMRAMVDAGVSVVCLSNGARDSTEAFLDRCGLRPLVDQVLSVADVRMRKPPRAVYDHAFTHVNQPADEVALVAVHAFDCHGAHAAGLTTGWAARLEKHYAEIFTPADVVGDDLVDVAHALTALTALTAALNRRHRRGCAAEHPSAPGSTGGGPGSGGSTCAVVGCRRASPR